MADNSFCRCPVAYFSTWIQSAIPAPTIHILRTTSATNRNTQLKLAIFRRRTSKSSNAVRRALPWDVRSLSSCFAIRIAPKCGYKRINFHLVTGSGTAKDASPSAGQLEHGYGRSHVIASSLARDGLFGCDNDSVYGLFVRCLTICGVRRVQPSDYGISPGYGKEQGAIPHDVEFEGERRSLSPAERQSRGIYTAAKAAMQQYFRGGGTGLCHSAKICSCEDNR